MRGIGPVAALAAIVGLLGCDAPGPGSRVPPPMDDAAVRALYATPHRESGTVMQGAHKGAQWIKRVTPDGGVTLVAGHGLFEDRGTFVIRGNMVCTRWGFIDHGQEGCERLVRVGADIYMTYGMDGVEGSKFEVLPP